MTSNKIPKHLQLLTSLYAAGTRARNALYDRGTLKPGRLQGPVISIGNLSVGGSGKTPFVLLLGQLLKARGLAFDILSRGYGRRKRGITLVDVRGTPHDYGDEPLLIARRLGVPVVVGENRFHAGQFAETKFGPQLHLLDDGFQHRSLARDFDIVLVTPEDAHDHLLPAGRLREPLSALSRADAVVLTMGASLDPFPLVGKLVWRARREIAVNNAPTRPVAFCGIARPQNFFLQLRLAGVQPVAEAIYRDHHAYSEEDVRDLLQLKQKSEADGFVATEKDEINLGPYLTALQRLTIIPLKIELPNAAEVLDTMLRIVQQKKTHA